MIIDKENIKINPKEEYKRHSKEENDNNNDNNKIKLNYAQKDNDGINMPEEKQEKQPTEKLIRNIGEKTNNYNILKNKIEKLGGQFISDEKNSFDADIFLTGFYDEKDNIKKGVEDSNKEENNKITPIVHSHYIEICSTYLFQLNIEDFKLSSNLKVL